MSLQYQAIGWNRQKRFYDAILAGSVVLYLALFTGIGALVHPNATAETLLIRGFGTAAILLLNVILGIGPLCRLNPRFLPLLYNRRHLGVTTFLLALVHGVFSIVQFHALGDPNPLVSVFVSNPRYGSFTQFPFQSLGFFRVADSVYHGRDESRLLAKQSDALVGPAAVALPPDHCDMATAT